MPTEILIFRTDSICELILTWHGALTHTANFFNVKIVDIIEENRKVFTNVIHHI